jgi:GcrA cell cycle regulator
MFVATWTTEQIATLRKMQVEGATAREIAQVIGKTRNAVLGKMARERDKRPEKEKPPKRQYEPRMTHYSRDLMATAKVSTIMQPCEMARTPHDDILPDAPGLVLMEDLRAGTCRFPLNNARHGVYYFCGETAMPLGSYCAAHHALCYVKKKEG